MDGSNPCVSCGACCAFFRVQFYWREANPGECEHVVPAGYFEDADDTYRVMKGTGAKHHPACAGLEGRIGRDARCGIYEERPTPCRRFEASYATGTHRPRCDQARRAHGLPPLKPSDWTK